MIRVELTPEDKKFCWKWAQKRSGSMGDNDTKNSHSFGMNSKTRHYVGLLGERAYGKYIDFPVDTATIGRGDDGTDFPDGIQVKGAMTEKMPNLLIPVDQYDRKPCESYVLVWVKKTHAIILGIINREVVEKVKKFIKEGDRGMYCDTWWVDREHLIEVFDI